MLINQVSGVVTFISQVMSLYPLTSKKKKERKNNYFWTSYDVTAFVVVHARKEGRPCLPENEMGIFNYILGIFNYI